MLLVALRRGLRAPGSIALLAQAVGFVVFVFFVFGVPDETFMVFGPLCMVLIVGGRVAYSRSNDGLPMPSPSETAA